MTIYATSDLHGQLEGLNPSFHDVCVIAGDIAPLKGFGPWHIHEQAKWMRKNFCSFCDKYPEVEFVIIPGNHDWAAARKNDVENKIDNSIKFPKNVHVLIDSEITISGKRFYGTPWVPIINRCWAYEADSYFLKEKFSKIPEDVDVLITHSPPHINGEYVDYSMQNFRGPFGSSELTQEIFKKKPKTVICGHIHSGDHKMVDFEGTNVYNVSRIDEGYEVYYEPTSIIV